MKTRHPTAELVSTSLTCDLEKHFLDPWGVRRHLTLIVALVTSSHKLDLQSPVIGVTETKRDSLVGAVGVSPHRQ
jgi:hypothetical protein